MSTTSSAAKTTQAISRVYPHRGITIAYMPDRISVTKRRDGLQSFGGSDRKSKCEPKVRALSFRSDAAAWLGSHQDNLINCERGIERQWCCAARVPGCICIMLILVQSATSRHLLLGPFGALFALE